MPASAEQRIANLTIANDVRARRKDLKGELAAGKLDVRELLTGEIPDHLRTMRCGKLLIAVPKVGRAKVTRILARHTRGVDLELRRLSPVTRRRIAEDLPTG